MEWTSAEVALVRQLAAAVEVNLDPEVDTSRSPGLSGNTGPEKFWTELSRSVGVVAPPGTGQPPDGLVSFIENVAHKNQIDTSDRLWRVKALAVALLQHADLDGVPDERKKGTTGYEARREADLHEKWIRANQLKALMTAKLGRTIALREWAEEIARRSLGLAEDHATWSESQADKHLGSADYHARDLKDLSRDYESLLAKYNFVRPSMRRNSTHWTHTQAGTSPFIWAPSDSELMEQSEWQRHMKQLREEHLLEAKRRRKR